MDEKYFNWLYEQVTCTDGSYQPAYTKVSALIHRIAFNDNVPHDSNRTAEARELRTLFTEETGNIPDSDWVVMPVSIFEVLVALVKAADFLYGRGMPDWYDIIMRNVGMDHYMDELFEPRHEAAVNRIWVRINDRAYNPSGHGGLFPLEHPKEDQRKVELWYQLSAYVIENKLY
jgi:hypothetical protein